MQYNKRWGLTPENTALGVCQYLKTMLDLLILHTWSVEMYKPWRPKSFSI